MFENLTGRSGLPSLNSLRAFEAMARRRGATAAAEELGVTHSAVSRQVKTLEARLGVRLFEGPRHDLRLTAEGAAFATALTPAFDALTEAVRSIRRAGQVHLAIHPSLAVKWLIPRLADFHRRRPDVELHVQDLAPGAVKARGADLSVRIIDGEDVSVGSVHLLAPNRIGPVCAPGLVATWRSAARLSARTHARGWSDWSRLTGTPPPDGPHRDLAHLHFALDAAIAGVGVAVLPQILCEEAITQGRLCAPEGFVPDGGSVVAVLADKTPDRFTRATLQWLREQIAT